MAHTKSSGTSKNNRDSNPKYLGVKKFGGEVVKIGDILIRQRGTKFHPGEGVRKGADDTLFSLRHGFVKFSDKRKDKFDGHRRTIKLVHVVAGK